MDALDVIKKVLVNRFGVEGDINRSSTLESLGLEEDDVEEMCRVLRNQLDLELEEAELSSTITDLVEIIEDEMYA